MAGRVDYKHDVIGDLDVAGYMYCDDLPMDLSPEFTALAEVIMAEDQKSSSGSATTHVFIVKIANSNSQ